MVNEEIETKPLTKKDFPEKTLGRTFPNFTDFLKGLKPNLGFVVLKVIKIVTEEKDGKKTSEADWTKTYEKGLDYHKENFGLGILTQFIARVFYFKFRNREYVGEERSFVDEFLAELATVIAEIRRKEVVWSQLFLEIDKLAKNDKTETRKTQISNKGGRNTSGDSSKYQVLSTELTDKNIQRGNVSIFDQKGTNTTISYKGTNYASLGRIINSLSSLNFIFASFYARFEHLWNHYCPPPKMIQFIDRVTGKRKWVTEEEYEEIIEPEEEKVKKKKLGTDPYELLAEYEKTKDWNKYLEALKAYHDQNEKEWLTLPDSSNRKNRIERRVKIATGCLKAYEREVNLPSSELFLQRIRGEVEGYQKVIGYEKIIQIVANYLRRWKYAKEFGGKPPEQLMIGLLGDPGLGKSYIAEAIGKALGDGKRLSFHRILMTGKKDSSIIEGGNMDNPGSDPGEIIKGISRCQNQSIVFFFDEIEKAFREAKLAIGEPTDRTNNKNFKDIYFDFPTPINNVIFFCALNYPEELDLFIRDRFKMIVVNPPSYQQRLEILRSVLQSYFKLEAEALKNIYNKNWKEVYDLVNQETLLKKCLTKTLSIRKSKENVTSLFETMQSDFFMEQKPLLDANGWVNYEWDFSYEEELDLGNKARNKAPCPYGEEKSIKGFSNKAHKENCSCFVNNLDRVEGWKENMEK